MQNNKIHTRIDKGVHSLQETRLLENKQLRNHLSTYGYIPTEYAPGLWKHDSNKIIFILVVDDFLVKLSKAIVDHIINNQHVKR